MTLSSLLNEIIVKRAKKKKLVTKADEIKNWTVNWYSSLAQLLQLTQNELLQRGLVSVYHRHIDRQTDRWTNPSPPR